MVIKNIFAAALVLISILSTVTVEAGTTTDTSTSRRYQENFNIFNVGAIPSDTWYNTNTAGTGVIQVVESGCSDIKCLQVSDGAAPYAAQILNLGTGVNLCNSSQSVQFDMIIPDLSVGAVWEYRVTGVNAVAAALPANSIAIRFTGLVGSLNEMRFVVRGSTLAENGGGTVVTSVAGNTNLHALISNGNCGGTASFIFTITGGASVPATARSAQAGDPITIQLNRVGIANPIGASGSTAYFDNYDWQGAPLPAITITGISPQNGFAGTPIAISGTGFQQGITVKVGVQNAVVTQVALNEVRFTAPNNPTGSAVVTLTNTDNSQASTTFTYNAVPVPPNCSKLAGAENQGVSANPTFLFDTYQGDSVGSIPNKCWYQFSVSNINTLGTTTDTWFDGDQLRDFSGVVFDGFAINETTSLKVNPSLSGYSQLNWKQNFGQSDLCTNGVYAQFYNAVSASAPFRIGVISSSDLTELQTPNTGSAILDINPGTSTHTLKIYNNDGTFNNLPISLSIASNQYYLYVIGHGCNILSSWDFSTGTNVAANIACFTIWNTNGDRVAGDCISGNTLKIPTYNIDTFSLHCSSLCYQDLFATVLPIKITSAINYANCSGTTDKFVRGFDFETFGIVKVKGPDGVPACGPSIQIHTFDNNLAYLSNPPGFNNFDNPEICYQDYGVMTYAADYVGICYNDDYPSSTPADEEHCLYIRNKYFNNNVPSGRPELEGDANADALCEENPSTWSQELAAMDRFAIDYSETTSSESSKTFVGFGFSEANKGIMGAYVEFFYDNADDDASSAFIQVAPDGVTVTQICAFSWDGDDSSQFKSLDHWEINNGPGNTPLSTSQYIAGIAPGYGIKLARVYVTIAPTSSTVSSIELREIPISNPLFKQARGLDCAGDKLYLTTNNYLYIIRAVARESAEVAPSVGQIIYSTPLFVQADTHLISINNDGQFLAVGTSAISIFNVLDENNIKLIGSTGYPSTNIYGNPYGAEPLNPTSTLKWDDQGNYLYMTTNTGVFKYDMTSVTHGGQYTPDPNPNQGGPSGYQDSDNDFISDIFDPCLNNPDADDDGIIDGNDSSFTCGTNCPATQKNVNGLCVWDGTELSDCSTPGACNTTCLQTNTCPGQPNPNGGNVNPFQPGNNPFGIDVEATSTGLGIPTLAVYVLIGVVFMLVLCIWVYVHTQSIALSLLAGFAGLILTTVMGFMPIWIMLAVIFAIIVIVGMMFFGNRSAGE